MPLMDAINGCNQWMPLILSLMTNAINGIHQWTPSMETINAVINGHHSWTLIEILPLKLLQTVD
jgi:hypothetical protein